MSSHDEQYPQPLLWTTGGSLAVLVISRPISPLWAILMVAGVAIAVGRRTARQWAADRTVRAVAGVVVGAFLVAGAWLVAVGRPPLLRIPGQRTDGNALLRGVGQVGPRTLDLVGDFFAKRSPAWIAGLYGVGLVVLLVSAMRHRARLVVASSCVLLLTFVVSTAFEVAGYRQFGLWWRSRYALPVLLGVPLLLTAIGRPEPGWARRAVPVGAAAGQAVTMAWVLHRYASGVHGSWWIGDFAWNPPLGRLGVVAASSVALVAFALALGGPWAGSSGGSAADGGAAFSPTGLGR